MGTGFQGTFVISWSQTEVDGLRSAPLDALDVGAGWAWHGDPVRVDGPADGLRMDRTGDAAANRRSAARTVRQLVGAARSDRRDIAAIDVDTPLFEAGFVVSDGSRSFSVTLIEVGAGAPPLLMFLDQMPPRGTDLWVVHRNADAGRSRLRRDAAAGVICFTHGTRIDAPDGPVPVERLREGDRVLTRDNGPQEILWIGSRRISGARMFAMPELRPIRIDPGALGIDRPDAPLRVSPDHRLLIRSHAARALFNAAEVLVPARELVDGRTVGIDLEAREVTYVHLLLADHQILWANGIESESFHPASARLDALSAGDRARLLRLDPRLEKDPVRYGGYARRALSPSEVAILMHDAA
ncbi:Hint domain-containing protein [Marinibacterium sp. SX1]|uniref:Hint domain-containing protein n=1 Tax=Marinibacterium sp. SX1 TaxID=3388424 RepID=UPI003D18649B